MRLYRLLGDRDAPRESARLHAVVASTRRDRLGVPGERGEVVAARPPPSPAAESGSAARGGCTTLEQHGALHYMWAAK